MKRLSNLLANVLLGAAILYFCFSAVRQVLARREPLPAQPLAKGMTVPIQQIDWARNGRTVLVALAEDCPFSSQGAPFYKKLSKEASVGTQLQLLAIMPPETAAPDRFLTQLGLNTQRPLKANLAALGIVATPTIVSVDARGIVAATWSGKLAYSQEEEVLSHVRTGKAPDYQEPLQPADFITAVELRKWQPSGRRVTMLDLREREEFRKRHIEGFVNIPLGEVQSRSEELGETEDVVAFCGVSACVKSNSAPGFSVGACVGAKRMLIPLGFKRVRVLSEGLDKIQASGLSVVSEQ